MSNEVAIAVENLGKSYRIRHAAKRATTLVGAMKSAASAPFKYLGEKMRAADESEIFWALKDVSFEVRRGEVVGIVGRNGAGKSTLLKILSRITDPSVGRAQIHGRVNALLEVGTGFHEELSGRENVYMNAALHGLRKAEIDGKFDEIVDFSGVEKFIDTPVKRYSSGMRVRLGFAVAASLEPDILVVDEVLAVGDQEFQNKCIGRMEQVTSQGRTVLFVSHNMRAVKSLCHRAVLLANGRKVTEGGVDEVIAAYLAAGVHHRPDGEIPVDALRDGTGEARFTHVRLLDLAGVPITQIYLGQPFRVELTLDAHAPIEKALIRVSVCDMTGEPIATAISLDRCGPAFGIPAGSHRLEVDFEMDLLPRHYTVGVSIAHAKDGVRIDGVDRSLEFSALSFAASGADAYPWNTVHGFIRPRAAWRLPPTVIPQPYP